VLLLENAAAEVFRVGQILAPELLARKHRDVAETKSARGWPHRGVPRGWNLWHILSSIWLRWQTAL